MKVLEIPEDVIAEVVNALERAIALAMHKAPDMAVGFSEIAIRLEEAIDDAVATDA